MVSDANGFPFISPYTDRNANDALDLKYDAQFPNYYRTIELKNDVAENIAKGLTALSKTTPLVIYADEKIEVEGAAFIQTYGGITPTLVSMGRYDEIDLSDAEDKISQSIALGFDSIVVLCSDLTIVGQLAPSLNNSGLPIFFELDTLDQTVDMQQFTGFYAVVKRELPSTERIALREFICAEYVKTGGNCTFDGTDATYTQLGGAKTGEYMESLYEAVIVGSMAMMTRFTVISGGTVFPALAADAATAMTSLLNGPLVTPLGPIEFKSNGDRKTSHVVCEVSGSLSNSLPKFGLQNCL